MGSKTTFCSRMLSGAAVVAIAAFSGAARAETADFAIPPQPLGQALKQFGAQSGHTMMIDVELVRAKSSQGVVASAEPEVALRRILAGTGLSYKREGDIFAIIAAVAKPAPVLRSVATIEAAETVSGSAVEGLVVTAQKRRENIQDVPIAISAFTQDELTISQVAGGPDLMTQVPNMTFTKTNFSGYSIQIRGIGTQAISATTDPAVAIAFNNTSFIRNHFFEQEFYDLERVEVLRGPQGTLYGRNATAGVVNVISAKPSFEYETKVSVDLANYDSRRIEGMVNFPLVDDKMALRIAGAWTKREGFVTNLLTGQQTDGRDLWSGRVTLGLAPSENLSVNLIYEHFQEDDDRLRSGKQLCKSDPGLMEVNGKPVEQSGGSINFSAYYFTQGCKPASLYGEESFDTPNGYGLAFYGALQQLGSPTYYDKNPYVSQRQSHDLRAIETHLKPEYEASADIWQIQMNLDLPNNLTLTSETGYSNDRIFSFEDYNRFDTTPGVFVPGGRFGNRFDLIPEDGVFCDPQLGCTSRLAAGDLSQARSKQFSQEFRLSSSYDGPFNFSLGANFLRYDNEDKYYVFINTLTAYAAGADHTDAIPWIPGVTDNFSCLIGEGPQADVRNFYGEIPNNPNQIYTLENCQYIDPNDIHHLNGNGRNYFLSRNPYHLLSYAAFGETYYQITPDLKLTTGLRWTVDHKKAPQLPSWLLAGGSYGTPVRKVINLEWTEPTGRIALDWKPDFAFTDDTLLYASYVHGYKAGGSNPPPPVVVLSEQVGSVGTGNGSGGGDERGNLILAGSNLHPETFDAEFVDAFEIGTKNTFLDGGLTFNLNGFYYDYEGYQISQIIDRAAINSNFDATIWGGELEIDWNPLENLHFGFKGGYENTRVADGERAIDTMDRTAGREGWIVIRPFPTLTANCVVPESLVTTASITFLIACASYKTGLDPVTELPYVANPPVMANGDPPPPGYAGYDPRSNANANQGEGFFKDLSGNELPNAPDITATITADYTLPLGEDWLMTLHTDLYYQSEAWTRIFNTEGYDKLKAYSNINFAAIFTNEDSGWNVMAYVKNVLDRDSITGSFLNSDDTGLTTNIFLTEPRLYGVRVSKSWSGIPFWKQEGEASKPHEPGTPYLFTVEVGGQAQRTDAPNGRVMPYAETFSSALDPRSVYDHDFSWTDGREAKLTYRPGGGSIRVSAGVRYGRTNVQTASMRAEEVAGPVACLGPLTGKYAPVGMEACDPDYVLASLPFDFYSPDNFITPINRVGASAKRQEEHSIVDFGVGKDVGLGVLRNGQSALSVGVRFATFKSSTSGDMTGVPDMYVPDGWGFWGPYGKYPTTFHHYEASFESEQTFEGGGPTLSWEASKQLLGDVENGHLDVEWALTGGVLLGKQKTTISGATVSDYFVGSYPEYPNDWASLPETTTPFDIRRNKSVTVPVVDLSLGLSVEVQGFKLGAGYRWERYFNVLDGGYQQHKDYDRTIDGPYVKIGLGFGG